MSFFRKFAVLAALGFLFVGCGEETVIVHRRVFTALDESF